MASAPDGAGAVLERGSGRSGRYVASRKSSPARVPDGVLIAARPGYPAGGFVYAIPVLEERKSGAPNRCSVRCFTFVPCRTAQTSCKLDARGMRRFRSVCADRYSGVSAFIKWADVTHLPQVSRMTRLVFLDSADPAITLLLRHATPGERTTRNNAGRAGVS